MNDELRVKNNELGGKMKYRYRTDEEMKDSGVEWIGEIPKEWSITKLKYISCCEDGKRVPLSSDERGKMQGDIPYWGANSIIDYVNDYLIDYEVVLLGEDGAPFFDKTKPVAFYSNGKIWPNNHIHILKSQKDMDSRFLVNSLNIVDYKNYIKGSTRDKLTQADMKEIIIQIPKLKKEQIKISKFLDEKTAQFDSIISKKEALIEKLEEAKKSLISEVVTGKVRVVKTDDGYELVERKKEEMKDSGVEWLGDVYSDWCIMSIKRLSRIGRGASPRPIDNPDYFSDDGEYAWTRISDVSATGKYLLKTTQRTSKLGASLSVKLEPNKLFLSIAGSVGKPCITAIKACIHDGFVYFPDLKEFYTDYLYYIFEGGQCYKGLGKLGTQLNLNRETVGDIKIAVPNSKDEIVEINNFLQQKLAQIEKLIENNKKQILLFKEAKQSLISEAVTGKIEILD